MTRRGYADVRATSPDGRFLLECLSADNGNDLSREGAPVAGERLGVFQRNFRYQLRDVTSGRVVWERWQPMRGEGSPVWAAVSNEGWVVARTHFLSWTSDDLVFFAREGKKSLTVRVSPKRDGEEGAGNETRSSRNTERLAFWVDAHVNVSTAGPIWTAGSFAVFVRGDGRPFFSLRTGWGRRLVVDLEAMSLLESPPASLNDRIARAEREQALEVLAARAYFEGGGNDWAAYSLLVGALAVAAAQEIAEAGPLAQELQSVRGVARGRACHALGTGWMSTSEAIATLARLVMRRSGLEPRAGGNYTFGRTFAEAVALPFDESRSPGAAVEAISLPLGTTAPDVVAALGAPDWIEDSFIKSDRAWSETWSYDARESTTRLRWSMPAAGARKDDGPRHLVEVVSGPPEWRGDARLLAILEHVLE